MVIYWVIFIMATLLALNEKAFEYKGVKQTIFNIPVAWLFLPLFVCVVIGFRFEVGGDWGAYLKYYERIEGVSFENVWLMKDPGYQVLNYIGYNVGGGIYTVNFLCGLIFVSGLMKFCSMLPRPMLGFVTAIPYMTIVIAMGYSRQACALSLIMLAIHSLMNVSIFRFIFWVVIAALFHKSAVLLMPVAALLNSKNRLVSILWILLAVVLSYITLLQDSVDGFYTNYVEANYQSQGALIRIAMCLVPSLIFIVFKKRFDMSLKEKQLWYWFALGSIGAFTLLLVSSASTAIDRVALYLLPIQLVIFSYLPEVLGNRNKNIWIILICSYYALVQFVWLVFADNRSVWVPYQFYPFTLL